MTADWALLVYNQALLQLYRPRLTDRGADQGKASIVSLCATLSADLCHAYRRQYFGKPTTYTWGALHELFLAGLTFIYCARQSSLVGSSLSYQYISQTCTDCTITFVILAERWRDAAPYRDLFEALSSSLLKTVSQSDRQRLSSSDDISNLQSQREIGNEPSFSKMLADFTEDTEPSAQVDNLLDALMTDWGQT